MAVANRYVGDNVVVLFDTGGATYTLTGDQTSWSVSWTIQSADVTAGTDGGVEEKPTLQDITSSLTTFHLGTAGTAVWAAVYPGVEGTIRYGPQGTASGKPKGQFRAFVQSKPIEIPFNEGVTRQVDFRGLGTMIADPDSATF